jgi:hypothetical protein
MTRRVPAVDASTGKIDDRIGVLDLSFPWTRSDAVPRQYAPGARERVTTQHDRLVTGGVKRPRKDRPDLT